jgi:hypothetical protein
VFRTIEAQPVERISYRSSSPPKTTEAFTFANTTKVDSGYTSSSDNRFKVTEVQRADNRDDTRNTTISTEYRQPTYTLTSNAEKRSETTSSLAVGRNYSEYSSDALIRKAEPSTTTVKESPSTHIFERYTTQV